MPTIVSPKNKAGVRGVLSSFCSWMRVSLAPSDHDARGAFTDKAAVEFDLFANVTRVVDLCAAPGSWSQVLSRVLIQGEKFGRTAWEDKAVAQREKLLGLFPGQEELILGPEAQRLPLPEKRVEGPRKDVKIVAVDLQPMSPLEGITCLRADITHPATVPLLLSALDPDYNPASTDNMSHTPVDLVLSDGAPDVTGLHDLDIYVQSQLLFAALNLALCVLKPGGTFVAKIFRGRNVDLLFAQLRIFFGSVVVAKPRSSRASSVEAFVVCRGFKPVEGYKPSLANPLGVGEQVGTKTTEETRWIPPFLACGDLSAYDADATYHLPKDRVTLDPVQPPTAPPYKRALEARREKGGNGNKRVVVEENVEGSMA
jgi:tRNA (cytidine32/guanosine34-2'-O)-methyltransferase